MQLLRKMDQLGEENTYLNFDYFSIILCNCYSSEGN